MDLELTAPLKDFANSSCKETFEDLVKAELFNRILTELFKNNIENVDISFNVQKISFRDILLVPSLT